MHVKTVNVTNPRNVLVQVPSFVIANWGVALGSHLEVHYDEEKIKAIRVCDRYNKGYSDVFICVHGILVLAELKDDTGTPTPHQEIFLDEMRAAGAIGGICRSVKDVADLVEQAKSIIK